MTPGGPSVGEPGYLPYCGQCTGLVRMQRGEAAFKCSRCGLETRRINGEDMFDRTAPLPALSRTEHHLLDWLSKEDHSAYGECHGKDYDRLEQLGLVHVVVRDQRGGLFNRVGLTEAGHALRAQLGEWVP